MLVGTRVFQMARRKGARRSSGASASSSYAARGGAAEGDGGEDAPKARRYVLIKQAHEKFLEKQCTDTPSLDESDRALREATGIDLENLYRQLWADVALHARSHFDKMCRERRINEKLLLVEAAEEQQEQEDPSGILEPMSAMDVSPFACGAYLAPNLQKKMRCKHEVLLKEAEDEALEKDIRDMDAYIDAQLMDVQGMISKLEEFESTLAIDDPDGVPAGKLQASEH